MPKKEMEIFYETVTFQQLFEHYSQLFDPSKIELSSYETFVDPVKEKVIFKLFAYRKGKRMPNVPCDNCGHRPVGE